MNAHAREERGSVAPLLVGFALVVALLVAAVIDASAAFLRRDALDSLADGAALAATSALTGAEVYQHGLGAAAPLDAAQARVEVAVYLRASRAAAQLSGLRWVVSVAGRTVVVRVSAYLDLPLHLPGVASRTRVTGTAAARAEVD